MPTFVLQFAMRYLNALLLVAVLTLTVRADVYNGNGQSGFGDPIGSSTLELTYDSGTNLVSGLITRGSGNFNDELVLYLDTRAGGFADTTSFVDGSDTLRRAISGVNFMADQTADLSFAPGFEADYAIAISPSKASFGGLWEFGGGGSLDFESSVGLTGLGSATEATYSFSFNLAAIGLSNGDSFDFVGTYLNANDPFRSNEGYGDGLPATNPGMAAASFTNFLTFNTVAVPEPSSMMLIGMFVAGAAVRTRNRKLVC